MKSITHESSEFTQETNTADVLTPVATIVPTEGSMLKFRNRADVGSAAGLPIFFKLYSDSGGTTELPNDTEIMLRAERPDDDEPRAVSTKLTSISSWRQQDLSTQQDSDHIDSVKIPLKDDVVNIRYWDELTVEVKSSAAIDWTASEMYVYQNSVTEHGFNQ